MLSSIIALLIKLPAILNALQSLSELIKNEIDKFQIKQGVKKFDKAIPAAKKTKDTSDLEKMFNPGKK